MNNETQDPNFMVGGFNIGNFDPTSVQEEEVILMCIAMDISGSVQSFEPELNQAFSTFIEEMQKSHVAPKLMCKVMEFGEKVYEKSGFMPITSIDPALMQFKARDGQTVIYDAAIKAIESTVAYREQLEKTGIGVKVLVFIITDGANNGSKAKATDVAKLLDGIAKEERNVFSFETILFGVGPHKNDFEEAQKDMHFKHLAVVGQSAAEIRKMIGFISASVSKSSSNQTIAF